MVFASHKENNNISVCTYNLHIWSNASVISDNILKLKNYGVDIFCLQEIQKIRGKQFVGDLIQKKLGKDWQMECFLGDENLKLDHGLAILWNTKKVKALRVKKMLLPLYPKSTPLFWLFMRRLTGFNHSEPDQRKALSIIFKYKNNQLQIITTHIDIVGGQTHRLSQHKFIKKQLLSNVDKQVICGDFNTIGKKNRKEIREIQKVYGKDFLEVSSDIVWTQDFYNCPLAFAWLNKLVKIIHFHFKQKLDHVLVRGFNSFAVKRIELNGSDHLPVIARLDLNS